MLLLIISLRQPVPLFTLLSKTRQIGSWSHKNLWCGYVIPESYGLKLMICKIVWLFFSKCKLLIHIQYSFEFKFWFKFWMIWKLNFLHTSVWNLTNWESQFCNMIIQVRTLFHFWGIIFKFLQTVEPIS